MLVQVTKASKAMSVSYKTNETLLKPNESVIKIELEKILTKEVSTNTETSNSFNLNFNEKKLIPENKNGKSQNNKYVKKADKSMGTLLKTIIFEVFSKSTMHGVSKIFNSKNYLVKFMWTIFLFVCVGLFAHMAILSLLNYSRHDVTTKIRTIYERPTLFPTVTICNKNLYTTDYAIDQLKSDIDFYHLPNLFNYSELIKIPFYQRKSLISGILYTFSDKIGVYSDIEKKKLGHDIGDILIECNFSFINNRSLETFIDFSYC